jgi:predicted O-linked N-acetylglucosamine transferase (SPINDLY family)
MTLNLQQLFGKVIFHINRKEFDDASTALKKILKIDSSNLDALYLSGVVSGSKGNHQQASKYFEEVIRLDPKNLDALSNLAQAYYEQKKYVRAIEYFERVFNSDNSLFSAITNIGNCYKEMGNYDAALNAYYKAIKINPTYAEGLLNIGFIYYQQKKYAQAIEYYDQALQIRPDYVLALTNRANALFDQRLYLDAIHSNERALAFNPKSLEALNGLGMTLAKLKKYQHAESFLKKAINVDPLFIYAWFNLGNLYNEMKQFEQAYQAYLKAYEINPDFNNLLDSLIFNESLLCNWVPLSKHSLQLKTSINTTQNVYSPFKTLSVLDASLQKKSASRLTTNRFLTNRQYPQKLDTKNKIKIGYFSSEFRTHAVSILTAELYELHNKDEFEVHLFSLLHANKDDEYLIRLKKSSDFFYELENHAISDIVKLCHNLEIQIAVDLGGHTEDTKSLEIFSHRVAPIQINYLGYPGTSGAPFMDYIIGDRYLIPETHQNFYSEKIIYMPNTFQVNDSQRQISNRAFIKEELNLPAEGFIFCCFNNTYKINPMMFDVWMRILHKTPNSVLWLIGESDTSQSNLRSEAKRRHIDESRIIFAGRLPYADYLARYQVADLFLDTLPFNAGTTASDALWAGLPLITCSGDAYAGRMAGSLLNAMGLNELIASSLDEYESLACELSSSPEKLQIIKQKLAKQKVQSPLFDAKKFTHYLEISYSKAWELYVSGLSPSHIEVE